MRVGVGAMVEARGRMCVGCASRAAREPHRMVGAAPEDFGERIVARDERPDEKVSHGGLVLFDLRLGLGLGLGWAPR